jgi:hypothetical protein
MTAQHVSETPGSDPRFPSLKGLSSPTKPAAAAHQQHAERGSGSPPHDSVGSVLTGKFLLPSVIPLPFLADIARGDQVSSIRFQLDPNKLQNNELERLHDFLARYHARVTTHYELAWHLSWLVETWLTQAQPELSPEDRHAKVREMLLA